MIFWLYKTKLVKADGGHKVLIDVFSKICAENYYNSALGK